MRFNTSIKKILNEYVVLREGYFHVPKQVFQHILDDYYEVWRIVQSNGIDNITPESLPTKDFDLDFSGTNFEFLNTLDPKPSIRVRYALGGGSYFSLIPSKKLKSDPSYKKNKGFIQIDLSNPYRVVIDIIEHEISHYIQDYIKKYTRIKRGEIDPIYSTTKGSLGGLPPNKILDKHEVPMDSDHSLIPTEYYPDLLSSIRQMEFDFSRYYPDYEYDENFPTKWEKEKKKFFSDVLKGNIKVPIASSVFKVFKTISKRFYNHMIKIAYDAFINRHPNLNVRELKRIGSELGLADMASDKKLPQSQNEKS